jgi:guanosine-3',5'-bis(diphosphate) 3'-pyrophosphohydrolase
VAGLPPSPLIEAALATATEAHAGQIRNGAGGIPYIEHPVAVAELLAEHGWAEEVLAAALLHDVIEDSELTLDDLGERFGEPVTGLVGALSDNETIPDWRERKTEHRGRVEGAGPEALAIYGADKLTNARALRGAWEKEGEAVADELKVPLDDKLEAWEADLDLLRRTAAELRFLDELESELSRLRAGQAAAAPRRGT